MGGMGTCFFLLKDGDGDDDEQHNGEHEDGDDIEGDEMAETLRREHHERQRHNEMTETMVMGMETTIIQPIQPPPPPIPPPLVLTQGQRTSEDGPKPDEMEVKAVRIVREVLEKCEDCATKVNWLAVEVKWGQGELFKKGEKGLSHFRDFVQKHPEVFSLDIHSDLIKLVIDVDVEPQRRLQTTQPTQSRAKLVPKAQAQGLSKQMPQPNKGTATKSAASWSQFSKQLEAK